MTNVVRPIAGIADAATFGFTASGELLLQPAARAATRFLFELIARLQSMEGAPGPATHPLVLLTAVETKTILGALVALVRYPLPKCATANGQILTRATYLILTVARTGSNCRHVGFQSRCQSGLSP